MQLICAAGCLLAPSVLPAQEVSLPVVNHLTIVLDSASLQQIVGSVFLMDQFAGSAPSDAPLDQPGGNGATFFGKHTWLQLVAPGSSPSSITGDASVTLVIEQPGGVATLAHRLAALHQAFDTGVQLRAEPPGTIPWFRWLAPAGADSSSGRFAISVIEFTVDAARQRQQADSLSLDNRTSARFIGARYHAERLMRDITGATLAVPVAEIPRIVRFARNTGLRAVVEGEEAIIYFDNFTLRLSPPWRGAGVKKLEFALTHDVPANPVYRFGPRSRLRFGPGAVAAWDFESQ